MRLIPRNKEEWWNIVPMLCKGYIAAAYILWRLSILYISGDRGSLTPPLGIIIGYVFSIIVLSFVAGIQTGDRKNKSAAWAFVFITIGAVFLSISFLRENIFRCAAFSANILASGFIFCYALNARKFQKGRALTYWIWAALINIVREAMLWACDHCQYNIPPPSLAELFWLGFILEGVLCVAALVLVVQQLQAKGRYSPSENTAMFVALGFLAAIILMAISFLRFKSPEFLPNIAINSAVLYFCFIGYRQSKATAFVFLTSAAILIMVLGFEADFMNEYHPWLFSEFMLPFSVLAIVLRATGIILIVHYMRRSEINMPIAAR